jgi:hypothetical protein
MRRWSRGRREVPSSVREVRGEARRASTRVVAEVWVVVVGWDWVVGCDWVWFIEVDCVRVCVDGGSAGGVRGMAGDAIVGVGDRVCEVV